MSTPVLVIRLLFILISALIGSCYTTTVWPGGFTPLHLGVGILGGALFAGLIIALERGVKQFSLRAFNLSALGILFGYLMGSVVVLTVVSIFDFAGQGISLQGITIVKGTIYLVAVYFGMVLTAQASDQLHLSIPFVRFQAKTEKKRNIVLDESALLDTRVIDLASSGLLDNHVIVPRFALKKFYDQLESEDEGQRTRSRRALDVLKKLEQLPYLGLRTVETDFPEAEELSEKFIRLAKLMNANILTADISRVQQSAIESAEGVRVINMNALSNALKPLTQSGETMEIKVQRYGKEPGQGVGYLEDGTMVVVNGGADYIGQTIRTHVLSVKHTSSGRMIFCNAFEDEERPSRPGKSASRSYFALER